MELQGEMAKGPGGCLGLSWCGGCCGGLEEAEAAVGDGEVTEAEGEGFGSTTSFDELGEFELDDVKAGVEEAVGELGGDLTGEDGATDVEGAAGHAGGVEFGDGDAAGFGVGVLDGGAGGGVEGTGIVEDVAGVFRI